MGKFQDFKVLAHAVMLTTMMTVSVQYGTGEDVSVEGDPYFLKTETNITVHEGELARLKCRVANLGTKMVNVVVWRRTTVEFPLTIGDMTFPQFDEMSVDHSQITPTSSTWDLLIKSVKPSHAGVYECHISATHHIAQYITLNVKEGSLHRSALKMSGTQYVRQGEKIHLVCNATGSGRTPDAIDWFYDGKPIYPSAPEWRGRVEILKHGSFEGKYFISELIIDRSTIEDKGDYVCHSSDLTWKSLKVHVLLSAEKDNLTRRVSGNEAQSGQMNTAPGSVASFIRADILHILLFVIITRIWR